MRLLLCVSAHIYCDGSREPSSCFIASDLAAVLKQRHGAVPSYFIYGQSSCESEIQGFDVGSGHRASCAHPVHLLPDERSGAHLVLVLPRQGQVAIQKLPCGKSFSKFMDKQVIACIGVMRRLGPQPAILQMFVSGHTTARIFRQARICHAYRSFHHSLVFAQTNQNSGLSFRSFVDVFSIARHDDLRQITTLPYHIYGAFCNPITIYSTVAPRIPSPLSVSVGGG